MARRKITIQEALTALKVKGVGVKVQAVNGSHQLEPLIPIVEPQKQPYRRVKQGVMKVTLFAQHTIACGGMQNDETGQIEGAGVMSYGPGICTVPLEYATALLYQDQQAKQADERMLDRTQHSYIIAQKNGPYGRANVGIRLPDNMDLDGFLGSLSPNNMILL